MAGINNRPGASSPQSAGLQRPGLVLALTGLNPAASTLVAENVTFCAKKPLFYAARASLSIAGFGPHRPGIGSTVGPSDWYSARFVLRPKPGRAGRFSVPEVATCTNSCRKKVFGKRLDYRCRLPATTWLMWTKLHPPPSSRSMFRSYSAHALLQQERRYSGGVEISVCRRTWDINCHQDPAPGRQQYGRSRRCP